MSAECPRYPHKHYQHCVTYRGKTNGNRYYKRYPEFSEGKGHRFESCRVRHKNNHLVCLLESTDAPSKQKPCGPSSTSFKPATATMSYFANRSPVFRMASFPVNDAIRSTPL